MSGFTRAVIFTAAVFIPACITVGNLEGIRLESRAMIYDVFVEGRLQKGKARGRPDAIPVMPDGALLVYDDRAGAIYRINHGH